MDLDLGSGFRATGLGYIEGSGSPNPPPTLGT